MTAVKKLRYYGGGDPDGVAGDGPGGPGLEGGQTQDGRQLHGRRAG